MQSARKSSSEKNTQSLRPRAGFTLLELMIVVVIIAILMGLLLPAINSVRRTARDAEVRADITALEDAIAKFKVTFQTEPPGQISLYPNLMAWEASPTSRRHKGAIKQLWPQFDFATCGGLCPSGTFTSPWSPMAPQLNLSGAECLVFFLGGMVSPTTGAFTGFSKDPQFPFGTGTNREGPFFEFKGSLKAPLMSPPTVGGDSFWNGRLTDHDGDWFPEYRDPLSQQTNPYVYFNGVNGYRTDYPTSPWHNTDNYGAGIPTTMSINNAYYTSFVPTGAPAMSAPYKPKGIQIISPGADGFYGTGGLFNPAATGPLSIPDRDNITNFHSGRLGG